VAGMRTVPGRMRAAFFGAAIGDTVFFADAPPEARAGW